MTHGYDVLDPPASPTTLAPPERETRKPEPSVGEVAGAERLGRDVLRGEERELGAQAP